MNTAILPPIGYRVPVGRHWFVQAQRNGGSEIKAAVSNGRVKLSALRRLFFFCRRAAD